MKKEERIARQKRLARAIQVREAQRRRRARLKNENQKFLQIIVPDALREAIFEYGTENNLTLQEAAVVLIEQALKFPSDRHSSITFTRSKSTPIISTDTEKPSPVTVKIVEPTVVPVVIPVAAEELSHPVTAAVSEPLPAVSSAVTPEDNSDPVWDVAEEDDGQMSLF